MNNSFHYLPTSTIGKVMETIIHNHITEHCDKFKLLYILISMGSETNIPLPQIF